MKSLVLSALCASLLMAGCSAIGPNLAPSDDVQARVPSAWRSAVSSEARQVGPWWATLSDPVFDELVNSALVTSPTLDIARARVDAARASRGQVFSGAWPSVSSSTTANRSQSGAAELMQGQASSRLDASWEVDLFGAVRRGKEGADARVLASENTLAATRLSLSAEVASAYLQYRVCQTSQAINQQDLASREATLSLTRKSVEVGTTAPYLLNRTQASVEDARAQRANLQSQCEQLEHLLVRLTAKPLDELQSLLSKTGPVPLLERTLDLWTVGLPADVLAMRPDVQGAQDSLAAATADVGLAMADQLPRLSLSGSLTYTAQDPSSTVTFGGWSFGPTLSIPLFDAGRRAAATKGATARMNEARANLESTVAQAVQEVNDGLSRYTASLQRKASAQTSADQYERFFKTVTLRYREGASSLLELEDARRAWLTASSNALAAKQEHLQAWIYLNRVTAGATAQ